MNNISGHKIYCSRVCTEKFNLELEIIKSLEQEIVSLKQELEEKDDYIKKIKKLGEQFENYVYETEQQYLTDIHEHGIIITDLKKRNEYLLRKYNELEKKLFTEIRKNEDYLKDIADLHILNNKQQKSCRQLDEEIKKLEKQLNESKQEQIKLIPHIQKSVKEKRMKSTIRTYNLKWKTLYYLKTSRQHTTPGEFNLKPSRWLLFDID